MQRDPSRTDQVFELNVALAGDDYERQFQSFLSEPDGHDLLDARPSLLDALADFQKLRALPANSLGREYLFLMESNGYTADGLRREAESVDEFARTSPRA